MIKNLAKHHIGIIIDPQDILSIEQKYSNKFHKDNIQKTRVMFVFDNELKIYKEFVVKEGRAKNIAPGLYHTCFSVECKNDLDNLEKNIKEKKMGYPITKLEKSGSKECGYVKFFFLKNYGLVEFNLLQK